MGEREFKYETEYEIKQTDMYKLLASKVNVHVIDMQHLKAMYDLCEYFTKESLQCRETINRIELAAKSYTDRFVDVRTLALGDKVTESRGFFYETEYI